MERIHLQPPNKFLLDQSKVVAATLGNFDGVHLGHQHLISKVVQASREKGGQSLVVGFEPHPVKILAPEVQFQRLYSLEANAEEIEKLGVDIFAILHFNQKVAEREPLDFLKSFIIEPFSPKILFLGYDFRFGYQRKGSAELVSKHKVELGIEEVFEGEAILQEGLPISSSRIRKALKQGEVEKCTQLLGRPYSLLGKVTKGAQRGRRLGFPTANFQCSNNELVPKGGVYVTFVEWQGRTYEALTNIGCKPTFNEPHEMSTETHILDFNEDLYGQELKVFFHRRLRDEIQFQSEEALVVQIRKDMESAKGFLKGDVFKTFV